MIEIHSNHLSEQWHECLCIRRRLSNKRNIYSAHFDDGIYVAACSEINSVGNFINVKCPGSNDRLDRSRKSIIQIDLEAKYSNFIIRPL